MTLMAWRPPTRNNYTLPWIVGALTITLKLCFAWPAAVTAVAAVASAMESYKTYGQQQGNVHVELSSGA